jgi:hypothetical protein
MTMRRQPISSTFVTRGWAGSCRTPLPLARADLAYLGRPLDSVGLPSANAATISIPERLADLAYLSPARLRERTKIFITGDTAISAPDDAHRSPHSFLLSRMGGRETSARCARYPKAAFGLHLSRSNLHPARSAKVCEVGPSCAPPPRRPP